jgi:hypothetical protein
VLLARAFAPAVDRYAVDVEGFASDDDEAFLRELPVPGIRRAGDFLTAGLLDLDSDLLVHDTRGRFRTERLAEAWRHLGRDARLETLAAEATEARLVEWLARAR